MSTRREHESEYRRRRNAVPNFWERERNSQAAKATPPAADAPAERGNVGAADQDREEVSGGAPQEQRP